MRRKFSIILILAVGLLASGCAHDPSGTAADNDPYEATNRAIFDFNMSLDRAVMRPVATFYVHAIPEPARDGVHNFITNIHLPVVFFNDVLQGDVDRAGQSLGRMTVNTTLGVGGLFDVASRMGIPGHDTDFGITLGTWGLDEGPFLMLPFLGPAPPRDLAGKVVDVFMDPITYWNFREKIYYDVGLGVLGVIDLRAQNLGTLEGIERTSVDYYATTRNLYLQYRAAQIRKGKPEIQNLPNF